MKPIFYNPEELTTIIKEHQPASLEALTSILEDAHNATTDEKNVAAGLSAAINRPVTSLGANQYAWDRSDGKPVILTITTNEAPAEVEVAPEPEPQPEPKLEPEPTDQPEEPEEAQLEDAEPAPTEDAPMTDTNTDAVEAPTKAGFFDSLLPLAKDCTLIITVAQTSAGDDPELTVTINPKANNSEAEVLAHPLSVTATAGELDAEFANLITTAVSGNQSIQAAQAELEAAKTAEAEAIKAEAEAKKAKASKKTKAAEKKTEPAKPAEPSLFGTPEPAAADATA